MNRSKWGIAAVAAWVVVLGAVPAMAAACARAGERAGALSLEEARETIRCVVAGERRAAGRSSWALDGDLAEAASSHARDMVDRGYFSHVSPGGLTVLDRVFRAGWRARGRARVGEVLAWGSGRLSTPRSLVTAWLRSPGHRRVLLDAGHRTVGVGVARGAPRRGARGSLTAVLVAAR
jgi:uncharacterized protein YkwD